MLLFLEQTYIYTSALFTLWLLLQAWASCQCDDILAVWDNKFANFENSHLLVCDVFLVYLTRSMLVPCRSHRALIWPTLQHFQENCSTLNYALAFVIIVTSTASSASEFLVMYILALSFKLILR